MRENSYDTYRDYLMMMHVSLCWINLASVNYFKILFFSAGYHVGLLSV